MATTRRIPGGSPAQPATKVAPASGGPPGRSAAAASTLAGGADAAGVEALRRQVIALQRISSIGVLAERGLLHELNNALTPILSYAKLGLRNPDPAYRERAARARSRRPRNEPPPSREACLMRCQRPDGGNLNQREPTDPGAAGRGSRPAGEEGPGPATRVRLGREVRQGARDRVVNLRRRFSKCCSTFLINARQAMPEGGMVRLHLRLDATGRLAELSVADTGVGIAPGDLRRIFEPFYSTKTGPTPPGRGQRALAWRFAATLASRPTARPPPAPRAGWARARPSPSSCRHAQRSQQTSPPHG